jgi:hypothetical protein
VEVWLGPMEGENFSASASSGGATIRVGRRRSDEKRGLKNDLVLAEGDGVSGFHAEVRLSGGAIRLKDLNSTNGTFAANRRVTGEVELKPGEVFLLSTTPLQAFLEDLPAPPVPSEADLAGSAPLAKMLAAVRGSASRHRDGWVDTRHLLDALARSKNAAVARAFETAGTTAEKVLEGLWGSGLLGGSHQWLRRFLAAPPEASAAGAPGGEPSLSVRVRDIFGKARVRVQGYSATEAEQNTPGALLTALLQAGRGPVPAWLADLGVQPVGMPPERRPTGRKTSRVARALTPPAADETARRPDVPEVTAWRPSRGKPDEEAPVPPAGRPAPAPEPAPHALPVFTTGDVVLDRRARAIAVELEETAVVYRFSTPEDRRAVLRAVVDKALASVAPGNRASILNQIRLQFPIADVPRPPAAAEDSAGLKARIRDLEKQLSELRSGSGERPEKKEASAGAVDWRALLAEEPPPGRRTDANLAALREFVASARRTERFVLGIVQAVTMPGSETVTFKLPGQRYTLASIFKALEQGKEADVHGLSEYLHDLERWQVAVLAGHHESGRLWFEKFWKKVAPTAIEAAAAKAGGWKLGGGGADLWNRYKDAVEGLSSDVVQDQILKAAFRFAQEEYERLTKGRS